MRRVFLALTFLACVLVGVKVLRPTEHLQAVVLDPTPHNWMNEAVDHEFVRFEKDGISLKMLDVMWRKLSLNPDFKRYQVVASKVYGPDTPMRRLLEALVQAYPVPDVDFIYYHQDILREHFFDRKWAKECAPILTAAKHKNTDRGILFIDWYYDVASQSPGSWNDLIRQINVSHQKLPWEKKVEKLFWRGSAVDGRYNWDNWTNFPRGRLVYESKYRSPELIDAAFINLSPLFAEKLGVSLFIPQIEQLHYKYHIDVDGVSCTYPALQWKLLSGCLVMKQTSEDVMWFHAAMVPWKHYVPVHTDLRDVAEKVAWAKAHDAEARQIAEEGREFALTHLMPEHILLYCYKTLLKYASLQKFQPAALE